MVAAPGRSGRDDAQAEVDEVGHIGLGPGEDLEIVRLVLLGDADLDETVELRPVLAATRGSLDEALDVGEAQDRGQARARNPPVAPLALPICQADGLEPCDRASDSASSELVGRMWQPAARSSDHGSGRVLAAARTSTCSSP